MSSSGGMRRREVVDALGSGVFLQTTLLISGVLAARILGPDGRGQLALIWIIVLTLAQVGMIGFPLAVTFQIAGRHVAAARLRKLVRPVVIAQCAVVSLLCLGGMLLASESRLPLVPAVLSVLVVPALLIQEYSLATLQGIGKFRALQILRTLPSFSYSSVLLVGWLAGKSGLLFVTSAWVVSFMVASLVTWCVVTINVRHTVSAPTDNAPTIPAMIRFGLAGFLGSVSPTETFRVDQLIVGLVLSTNDLGLYVTALAFCNLPRFLAQSLGLVAYPRIAAATGAAARRVLLWRFTAIGTAAALTVSLPLALAAGPLIELVFGPAFEGATQTTQVLLLGTVVLCSRRLLSDGLRGDGSPAAGSLAEALSLFTLVPALFVLVPIYGLVGVALALTASYCVSLATLLAVAQRRNLGIVR